MFEVGKEVICIKSHSEGALRKGAKYTVIAIHPTLCEHEGILLDVGIRFDQAIRKSQCRRCSKATIPSTIHWIAARLFAPIDNTLSETTIEQVLTEVEKFYQPA